MVICDLDNRDATTFGGELLDVLNACEPRPNTVFCLERPHPDWNRDEGFRRDVAM
jgi:hypothetical protein